MTYRQHRLEITRAALKTTFSREAELSDADVLRLHRRATRNPNPRRAMSVAEIVEKAQYRSRSRRTRK